MNILVITHVLNGLLMIAMPIGLAILLTRRWKLGGRIWWIGALTFVLSQVGHIPFNAGMGLLLNRTGMVHWSPTAQLIFNAAFLGLSAGLFEEGARYIILRFWLKDARSWRTGILFGAGHGGAEAIIFGALVLSAYIQLLILRDANPAQLAQFVSADQIELAQAQLAAYWSAPWYNTLLGAVERLFTIPCQIAMAVMVMQVFTRKNIGWLFVAIGYHALIDAIAVFGQSYLNVYSMEAIVGAFASISVIVIFLLYQPEPVPTPTNEPTPVTPTQAPALKPVEETDKNLDSTRYQ